MDLVTNIRRIIPGMYVCAVKFIGLLVLYCLYSNAEVTISSDFMAGFCGESEEEHNDTVTLMKLVNFDMAYMFAYSMRKVGDLYGLEIGIPSWFISSSISVQKTHAYHRMNDDVTGETKKKRLQELIDTFHSIAAIRNKRFIGTHQLVLVENVRTADVVGILLYFLHNHC